MSNTGKKHRKIQSLKILKMCKIKTVRQLTKKQKKKEIMNDKLIRRWLRYRSIKTIILSNQDKDIERG